MTLEQLDAFLRLALLGFVFIGPILAVSLWIERRQRIRWEEEMKQRREEAVMNYVKDKTND